MCHRSGFLVLDSSNGGHLEVWVESWDQIGEQARLNGPPLVVLEANGRGTGVVLRPSESLDLGVMLIRQAVRAIGAPKRWRNVRVQRVDEQAARIRARLDEYGCRR